MRPFFSYYGSKYLASRHYPEPEHPLVIEPFAGSACYSTFHNARRALLLDKSESVAATWRYLLGEGARDGLLSLPDLERGQRIEDHIPEAARAFVGFWCGKAQDHPAKAPNAWCGRVLAGEWDGMARPLVWGPRVRRRVSDQLPGVVGWTFEQADYRAAPDVEATWFIDPPYQGKPGSRYRHGSGGIDYAELADWCRSRKGLVIVCEGPGADWLPFQRLASVRAQPLGPQYREAVEMVWIHRTTAAPQGTLFGGLDRPRAGG